MTHEQGRVLQPAAWRAALLVLALGAITVSAPEALQGSSWLAEDIQGGGVIDNAQSTLAIAAGGTVTGSGGCNRLFGAAIIAGDQLTFEGIGSTRMACAPAVMDQERKFLDALTATRTFRLDGPYLKFYAGSGAVLVRFTALR
jgi:putative lipoprotein